MKWSSFFIGFIVGIILVASLLGIFSPNRYEFEKGTYRYDTWTGRAWFENGNKWIEIGVERKPSNQ